MAVSGGAVLLDVRTPEEFASGHLVGAVNMDLQAPDFLRRLQQLDPALTYVVYCHSGRRAEVAVDLMKGQGFNNAANAGGFDDLAAALPAEGPS